MSRQKGSRGEREVAHIIQEWWRKLERTAEFIRTPLSGGWQPNKKAAAHFKANGDLMTTAAFFPFCVEVKWREQWSVDNFLDGKPTAPWAWWVQTCTAAAKQDGDVPMMWMRKNRIPGTAKSFPWLVLVPVEFVVAHTMSQPDVRWSAELLRANRVDFGTVLPVAYDFNRFIEMAPQRMRTMEAK